DPVTRVEPQRTYKVRSRVEHMVLEQARVERFLRALEAYELAYTGELRGRLEELGARAHQQAVVAELSQRALAETELSALMDEVVTRTAQTLRVEYCKILELLPDKAVLLLRAGVGWKEGYVGHATVGTETNSQAGYTLLYNRPVVVEDLRTETRFSGPPLLSDHGVVSGMSVIIHGKERPFGVLGAHTTSRRTFTQDDIHFIQAVADVLAMAIERKRIELNLQSSLEKLQIDHQAFEAVSECIVLADLERKITWVNPACSQVTGYTLEELIGKTPKLLASNETPPYLFAEIGTSLIKRGRWYGEVVNRRKDGALWNCHLDIRTFKDLDGVPRGYIGLMRDITREKKRVELLEKQARDIEALHSSIKKQFEETIYMFAMACEAKDEVTGNHVLRIREYSIAIARELGLTEDLSQEIGLSGVLHDVGKIHIPESILRKPGPLTQEEWEVMKTHTLAGGMILYSDYFQVAKNIALYHHENWDGTGYPKGLKGAEIPIEARIARVADVFDALTTKRPYKPAWSEEKALEEIRAMKGKGLCPMAAVAFERAYQKGVISEIRQKYGN
ncbi:MAG: HD domain-containing phosphohydrolase, partial [Candidatus Brocadiales bacterium]